MAASLEVGSITTLHQFVSCWMHCGKGVKKQLGMHWSRMLTSAWPELWYC